MDRDRLRAELREEALTQILSEGGSVRLGKVAVLVQVEEGDLVPFDGELDERRNKLELRGARGDDDACMALRSDGVCNLLCHI